MSKYREMTNLFFCDDTANIFVRSYVHYPEKLTDRDREDVFLAVFAEINDARLSEKDYEENLLQHGVIR